MRLGLAKVRFPAWSKAARLPFPARPQLRIALVGSQPATFRHAQSFPADRWGELSAYSPQILIGSRTDLLMLAARKRANRLKLETVDHALFAITRHGDSPLGDDTRTTLWRAFGVPVYELFTGAGDRLLAFECEAHEGWHIEAGVTVSTLHGELIFRYSRRSRLESGLAGDLINGICPCGRSGVRISDVRVVELAAPKPVLAVA